MPDHDKPESTPDYASMFSNFLPGPSQPPQAAQTPQVAQTPASNPASPQPPKNETETDDFLANPNEPNEAEFKKQAIFKGLIKSLPILVPLAIIISLIMLLFL